MANTRVRSIFDISISKKDMEEANISIAKIIKFNNPRVTQKVAHETLKQINALGTVPVKTGALRAASVETKDKFKQGHIIGWTLPYARKVYFGARTKSRFVTIDGKRRRGKYYKNGTQPFFDRPVTRNKPLMLSIYNKAASEVYR